MEGDHKAHCDINVFHGANGLKMYNDFHQETVNMWRPWSGLLCDVDSRFSMAIATANPRPRANDGSPPNTNNLDDHTPAPCALHAYYDGDWNESVYARFRVTATATGSDPLLTWYTNDTAMLQTWIDALTSKLMKQTTHHLKTALLAYPRGIPADRLHNHLGRYNN